VTDDEWNALSEVDRAVALSAIESDIVPGIWGDITSDDVTTEDLIAAVLRFVDQDRIEVRRMERWITPDGRRGTIAGELVPRDQLERTLADPVSWDYPHNGDWVGTLTLVQGDAW